jgi:hypothetical protein
MECKIKSPRSTKKDFDEDQTKMPKFDLGKN